jgi:hypothetical protein
MSATAAQRRYWSLLAERGCLLCGNPAQIAHAHSGSIVERMQEPKAKGKKLQRLDWLVLPLCPSCHAELDADVRAWESKHGTQASMIDRLCVLYEMDLWTMAQEGRK